MHPKPSIRVFAPFCLQSLVPPFLPGLLYMVWQPRPLGAIAARLQRSCTRSCTHPPAHARVWASLHTSPCTHPPESLIRQYHPSTNTRALTRLRMHIRPSTLHPQPCPHLPYARIRCARPRPNRSLCRTGSTWACCISTRSATTGRRAPPTAACSRWMPTTRRHAPHWRTWNASAPCLTHPPPPRTRPLQGKAHACPYCSRRLCRPCPRRCPGRWPASGA